MEKKEKLAFIAIGVLIDRLIVRPSGKLLYLSIGCLIGISLVYAYPIVSELIGR